MDGDFGLPQWIANWIKLILILIIIVGIGFLGYMLLVAIPEQQAIIDKNEAIIKELNR